MYLNHNAVAVQSYIKHTY